MVESTIAKLIYKEWQEAYDNSTELSARSVFHLWWIVNSPKKDDGFFFSQCFPTDGGGWDVLKPSDYAIVELDNNGHISIEDNGHGAKFLRLTTKGENWISSHSSLFDQLTNLAETIIAKHSS